MRVAYRGNFRHPFCTEVHVAASLEALGHTVVRLQENETTWARCVAAAKDAHMFLWTKTWIIEPEQGRAALEEIRSAGVPSVSFHLDRYVGLDREAQILQDPFWSTDFVFTADGGSQDVFESYGVNHRWLPPGVFGPECRRGVPSLKFPHPVVFVGSHPYPHAEWAPYRTALIDRMRSEFGSDFVVWPRGRPIRNRELSDLYASAQVVVGDSCLVGNPSRYWSDRIPETLGRGGLLVHPDVDGLGEWYTHGEHLLKYALGDLDDAVRLVRWGLDHPAEARTIRTEAQRLVLARDTYEHRLQTVLEVVGAEHGFPEIAAPNETVVARRGRAHAGIEVRPGHPTDREVVDEVWTVDQYALAQGADVRGGTVVDVGANIGAFSVLAVALGARQVHAWEPEPSNFEVLRRNAAAFENVALWPNAVGRDNGKMWLSPGPGNVHGGGSHGGPIEDAPDDGGVAVDVIEINEVIDRAGGDVAFLKLDCEGGEYEIVAGIRPDRLERVKRIAMEFHGPAMPHLTDFLGSVDEHAVRFGAMVAKLATFGHVEIHGRPEFGGLLRWRRY